MRAKSGQSGAVGGCDMSDARDLTPPEAKPLTPANQNPWYVLMTLYGEQEGEEIDWELHEKNRRAWNIWSGMGMTMQERESAAKLQAATETSLFRNSVAITSLEDLHRNSWQSRNAGGPNWPGMPKPSEAVDFDSCVFSRPFVANGLVFGTAASFRSTIFDQAATFNSATFNKRTVFSSAKFTLSASFEFATFCGNIMFPSITFSKEVSFNKTTFSREVSFYTTTFCDEASFDSATFVEDSTFANSAFCGAASFHSATFNGPARFSRTTFSGDAFFYSSKFRENVYFYHSAFSGDTEYNSTEFTGLAYFNGTIFGAANCDATISFRDCHFAKPTNFRIARFKTNYPEFEGSVLHAETTFTAEAGDIEGPFWPENPKDPKAAKDSCAKIRNNIGKQGFPEAEHFFYRREMRFAGLAAANPFEKLAYGLFGLLSEYGYSFVRPALWLFALWFIGAHVFVEHFVLNGAESPIGSGLGLSFSNLFPYFGLGRQYGLEALAQGLPPGMKLVGGFQTVFGTVLLFLLALGLRTRFRMR